MATTRSPHSLPPSPKAGEAGDLTLRVLEAREVGGNLGLILSLAFHLIGVAVLLSFALLAPKRPSTVPIIELVNLSPPKLRPLRPKVQPPPEPPPPEPARIPDAPKLSTKPDKAVTPKKPEPKVVKDEPDTTLKPSENAPLPEESQPQIVSHVPADPRLSFWASRVKKKAEALWNPPTGLEISGKATAVVNFKVARDGTVSDAALSGSTGNGDLDDLALQSVQRMERVPPLPENYPEEQVQVSYEFVYKGQ